MVALSVAPVFSIVLTGRNDDHGVDFRTRFFAALRFNHRELSIRSIPHEFLIVEWAPPDDRPLLADLAVDEVPELAPPNVAWYVVDRRYQETLSLNPRLEYLEFVAKNVGLRRAHAEFLLSSNCDVYLGRRILERLERRGLQAGVVYRAPRHDLKGEVSRYPIDWQVLEDPQWLDSPPPQLKLPFMAGATGDFLLLDRRTFYELRGFNEMYRLARINIDRNFLVKAVSQGLGIEDIGGPVYHVNHPGSYRLSRDAYAGRESEAPWGDERWHSRGVVYENPPAWGLRDAPVCQVRSGCWRLDFSWDAVPPLVDLRRVVLPVARCGHPYPGGYKAKS
jgi:hypothetical protein